MQGDWHFLAADDGTNTQFDPGSANPGPPLLSAAPLDQNFTAAVTVATADTIEIQVWHSVGVNHNTVNADGLPQLWGHTVG